MTAGSAAPGNAPRGPRGGSEGGPRGVPRASAPPGQDMDEGGAGLPGKLEEVARSPRLLVALDFDGTLAPFRDDPADSRADPAAMEAVHGLAELPDTPVALVSGRELDSLTQVAHAPEGVALVGSHGLETRLGDGSTHRIALDAAQAAALAELDARLEALVAAAGGTRGAEAGGTPGAGAWVERKPSSVSLHTRAVEDLRVARDLETRAAEAARDLPGVDVLPGKRVVELAVLRGDKGRAVSDLRALLDADAVFYAGDDTTDERAFAALRPGDLGVHVGPGPTAAAHCVPDIPAMARVLGELLRLRAGSGDGSGSGDGGD